MMNVVVFVKSRQKLNGLSCYKVRLMTLRLSLDAFSTVIRRWKVVYSGVKNAKLTLHYCKPSFPRLLHVQKGGVRMSWRHSRRLQLTARLHPHFQPQLVLWVVRCAHHQWRFRYSIGNISLLDQKPVMSAFLSKVVAVHTGSVKNCILEVLFSSQPLLSLLIENHQRSACMNYTKMHYDNTNATASAEDFAYSRIPGSF